MRKTAKYPLGGEMISDATLFVQTCLQESGLGTREAIRGTLVAEEALGSLAAHAHGDGEVSVTVRNVLGDVVIEMSAPGESYSLSSNMASASLALDDDVSVDAQEAIQNILLRSLTENIRYRHRNGRSHIRMTVVRARHAFLYKTMFALLSALALGLLLAQFAPASFNEALDGYLLSPVKTVFLNALKAVVAPVVFFSIVSSISGFADPAELGRIGGRTFALYMLTTIIAVTVGIGSFILFRPGTEAAAQAAAGAKVSASAVDLSLKDTLMGFVPDNFLAPFLEANMPQLIFLAVLCGIATGLIGHYSAMLRSLFDACNELFLKIASIIIRFMPIAVFCSTCSMIISLGVNTLLSILGMFGVFLFGLVCMMLIYCLLVLFIGRLDPRPLIRKYAPVMLQVFSMASSNASIPVNMEFCGRSIGVGSKVYSLSIPLGATLNMDGTCVQLAVFALALARVYGVQVPGSALLTMAITIIILSMGAPGIPGAGVICLSVLLEQLHVPVEAVGLVMGIGPLLGMFLTMSNCLGDVVVTTIVAQQAGELDREKYRL